MALETRTLVQLGSATNSINVLGDVRLSPTDSLTCTMSNHADGACVFVSKEHGAPWVRKGGNTKVIQKANSGVSNLTPDVTVLFPNFDYDVLSA